MKTGFDHQKYIELQSAEIRKRIDRFGGKLYLEFGGKLFDDYHASRVLPGFQPDSKLRMLQNLAADMEIIIAICASDIEKNKVRGDLGISYEDDVLRLIASLRDMGLYVGSVVITRYAKQPSADAFRRRLTTQGVISYLHYTIPGYPSDVGSIVSEDGFGKNEYIETSRPLVVVTAPGPGSGKMATCLSQLYHDNRRGIKSGYAKFETFPVWNLPLSHSVNLAYEAATLDLSDVNMIDPYHLDAYGITTVNYNRDVEIFPVLRAMMEEILGASPYLSPTDMGVNMAGFCIADDAVVSQAAKSEILRRYYKTAVDEMRHGGDGTLTRRAELLMKKAGVTPAFLPAVAVATHLHEETGKPAGALCFPDGTVVRGKTSSLLGASAALLLNALKHLAGIPKEEDIISPEALQPICELKTTHLRHKNPRLHSDEVLIALSISSVTNPSAKAALAQLDNLRGCDAHFSVILSPKDEALYNRLRINITCTPHFEVKKRKPLV